MIIIDQEKAKQYIREMFASVGLSISDQEIERVLQTTNYPGRTEIELPEGLAIM